MTHAFCFFCSIRRWVRRGTSIALAPKKTIALQARWGPPQDVTPTLSKSRAGVIASLAILVLPVVVLVPSAGQAIGKAKEVPSEVAAQPVTKVMPPPTSGRAELSVAPVASTMVGTTQLDEIPPMEGEVMVAMMDGSQPEAMVATSEAAALPMLPVA